MGPFCWHVIAEIQFEKELLDSATRTSFCATEICHFSWQVLCIVAGQQSISGWTWCIWFIMFLLQCCLEIKCLLNIAVVVQSSRAFYPRWPGCCNRAYLSCYWEPRGCCQVEICLRRGYRLACQQLECRFQVVEKIRWLRCGLGLCCWSCMTYTRPRSHRILSCCLYLCTCLAVPPPGPQCPVSVAFRS